MTLKEAMEYILKAEVVASEVIRYLYNHNKITKEDVAYLLEWSGDDEYVTVYDITND